MTRHAGAFTRLIGAWCSHNICQNMRDHRSMKRMDAEERNAKTGPERTRSFRRMNALAGLLSDAAKAHPGSPKKSKQRRRKEKAAKEAFDRGWASYHNSPQAMDVSA